MRRRQVGGLQFDAPPPTIESVLRDLTLSSNSTESRATMPFDVSCPNCGVSYRVPDERIGKSARCKKCETKFLLSIDTAVVPRMDWDRPSNASTEDWLSNASAPDRISPPNPFGRYHILGKLGEGGMGAVYLAEEQEVGNRKVALKLPRPEYGRRPDVVARFMREVRIGQEFRHERFCAAYDWGRIGEWLYLSMEYIEGETLEEYCKRKGPLPEAKAVSIVRLLASALGAAHRRGIIHRDLKPSNVMIDKKGEIKITDFGLAKRSDADDVELTGAHASLGTPSYMPPEQLNYDKDLIGPRSDIYSLGVILFRIVTGRLPYEGIAPAVHAQLLSDRPPTSLSERLPGVNPALEAICLKAIAKSPSDRYESMEAFSEALRDGKQRMSLPATAVDSGILAGFREPAPVAETTKRGSSRWIAATAVIVLLAAIPAGLWLTRDKGEPGKEKVEAPATTTKTEEPTRAPEPPKIEVIENSFKMKLARIPAGKFQRGAPEAEVEAKGDETPRREITLTKPFWLGVHEVTQAQYRSVTREVQGVEPNPSGHKGDDYPVEQVSWYDAARFCNEMSRREGLPAYYRISGDNPSPRIEVPNRAGSGYRLPTEAEWEYACRAGSETSYFFGDDPAELPKHAWFWDNAKVSQAVGTKSENVFKIKDMSGNIMEWCEDYYDQSYYSTSPNQDPINVNERPQRVARGGAFNNGYPMLRSARRQRRTPEHREVNIGFRVARTAE